MSKKETKFNLEGLEEIANDEATNESSDILTDQQIKEVEKEIELERKYGDKNLRTFVESAASGATFGLSDQAISKFGGEEAQEALRERRQRNKEAALAGEVTGVVGPALLTGGTSAAAKGATGAAKAAISAGAKTAAKTGVAAEKITAKALAKLIDQTGKKKLAKEAGVWAVTCGTQQRYQCL